MPIRDQLLIVILCYLLSFLYIRSFLWGVKEYPLNTSARKKRKKGETLKEWFLYSRYRNEIPQILLIWYFIIVLIHPLMIIACIVLYFIKSLSEIGSVLAKGVFFFDGVWIIVIQLLFWKAEPGYKYERWINKKRPKKKM